MLRSLFITLSLFLLLIWCSPSSKNEYEDYTEIKSFPEDVLELKDFFLE